MLSRNLLECCELQYPCIIKEIIVSFVVWSHLTEFIVSISVYFNTHIFKMIVEMFEA